MNDNISVFVFGGFADFDSLEKLKSRNFKQRVEFKGNLERVGITDVIMFSDISNAYFYTQESMDRIKQEVTEELEKRPNQKIVFTGQSMGAVNAINMANIFERCDQVVVMSPVTPMQYPDGFEKVISFYGEEYRTHKTEAEYITPFRTDIRYNFITGDANEIDTNKAKEIIASNPQANITHQTVPTDVHQLEFVMLREKEPILHKVYTDAVLGLW